jgi:hypothetical protein
MNHSKTCAAAVLAGLICRAALAQEPTPLPTPAAPPAVPAPLATPPPPPPPPSARRPPTAMQVQIVVARTQAGKAISRLPYTISCNAEDGSGPASLRMGVEVPVTVGGTKGIQYRNVGINIDCTGESLTDGRYKLKIAVEQSSIPELDTSRARARGAAAESPEAMETNPTFRTFNTTFKAILRDGQSALYTAATDPVTGEEVTIEVSMKVLR